MAGKEIENTSNLTEEEIERINLGMEGLSDSDLIQIKNWAESGRAGFDKPFGEFDNKPLKAISYYDDKGRSYNDVDYGKLDKLFNDQDKELDYTLGILSPEEMKKISQQKQEEREALETAKRRKLAEDEVKRLGLKKGEYEILPKGHFNIFPKKSNVASKEERDEAHRKAEIARSKYEIAKAKENDNFKVRLQYDTRGNDKDKMLVQNVNDITTPGKKMLLKKARDLRIANDENNMTLQEQKIREGEELEERRKKELEWKETEEKRNEEREKRAIEKEIREKEQHEQYIKERKIREQYTQQQLEEQNRTIQDQQLERAKRDRAIKRQEFAQSRVSIFKELWDRELNEISMASIGLKEETGALITDQDDNKSDDYLLKAIRENFPGCENVCGVLMKKSGGNRIFQILHNDGTLENPKIRVEYFNPASVATEFEAAGGEYLSWYNHAIGYGYGNKNKATVISNPMHSVISSALSSPITDTKNGIGYSVFSKNQLSEIQKLSPEMENIASVVLERNKNGKKLYVSKYIIDENGDYVIDKNTGRNKLDVKVYDEDTMQNILDNPDGKGKQSVKSISKNNSNEITIDDVKKAYELAEKLNDGDLRKEAEELLNQYKQQRGDNTNNGNDKDVVAKNKKELFGVDNTEDDVTTKGVEHRQDVIVNGRKFRIGNVYETKDGKLVKPIIRDKRVVFVQCDKNGK